MILRRVSAASDATRQAEDTLRRRRRRRDDLVSEAIDTGGVTQREVAAAAGISKSRVIAIIREHAVRVAAAVLADVVIEHLHRRGKPPP